MNKGIVIIPTYNEAENVIPLIERIASLSIKFDIMVVDDNSPDGTADLVKQYMKSARHADELDNLRIHIYVRENKKGLGTAYIYGFKKALELGYDYIFEMDADLSHNPDDLIQLYSACADEGYDMAIGSRYISGVNVVNWPIGRVLLSLFASLYVKIVTGMPIQDPTAGFICYKRRVLETIDLDKVRFIGYAFQIEMKFTTWKYGFLIREIPIIFTDRKGGESKMSIHIFKEVVW
ncbi:MAG: polyprenol monophosphomannose synthase, partial [Cyclobacteriaceae bacterium]|nr:polyprenol monophosphomannose synthase [Cyclobacteriaceae bacterium]